MNRTLKIKKTNVNKKIMKTTNLHLNLNLKFHNIRPITKQFRNNFQRNKVQTNFTLMVKYKISYQLLNLLLKIKNPILSQNLLRDLMKILQTNFQNQINCMIIMFMEK